MAKLAQKEDQAEGDQYLKAAEILGKFGIEINEQALREAQAVDQSAEQLANAAQGAAQQTVNGGSQNGGNSGQV
jgi:hypothetical protein